MRHTTDVWTGGTDKFLFVRGRALHTSYLILALILNYFMTKTKGNIRLNPLSFAVFQSKNSSQNQGLH